MLNQYTAKKTSPSAWPRKLLQTALLTSSMALHAQAPLAGEIEIQPVSKPFVPILSDYGFIKPEQVKALNALIKQAHSGSKEGDLAPFLLSDRPVSLDQIMDFVEMMQKKFTIREGHQERWAVKHESWMEENAQQNRDYLTQLGLVNQVLPLAEKSDLICILGATRFRMKDRLDYATTLINAGALASPRLVLLAGNVKVTVNVDGDEAFLTKLASKRGKASWKDLTETDLLVDLYESSALFEKLDTTIIDTPRYHLPRPTTETTIKELNLWLTEHPAIKSITFVSNQPYVAYQDAVIESVFKKINPEMRFEVVGPMASNTAKNPQLIQALGTQIWAMTPAIIKQRQLKPNTAESELRLKKLFVKHPLIFSSDEPESSFTPGPSRPKTRP